MTNWLPDKTLFKNAMGALFTRGLFLERSYTKNDKSSVIYTLRDEDHPDGYKSLYKLYMETADPTEFVFANTYLDSYDHWMAIASTTWFEEELIRWRRDLEQKLKSKAMTTVKAIADSDGHKNQFEAIKILLNAGWKEKPSGKGAGRPTKEAIKAEIKTQANEERALNADLDRVRGYEE